MIWALASYAHDVALYFSFKKGFHRNLDLIWFNKFNEIFLSKIADFLHEINRLDYIYIYVNTTIDYKNLI